ncbi:uncharacterized protein LOC21389277 [Morus notabilis]|uniref:uncharacterized protein LOC21389277 n=1 Tax=Morus notabilis TaxID=981085 RepID=UPI000CECEBC7|nr:uncharacterized protein LOC21389277 [Morus notabilis]
MTEQEAVSEFEEKLKLLMAPKDQAAPPTALSAAKIQRVPSFLRERECLKKYFEPMWISFGPIHYNNPKLKVSEMCKLQLVAKFIRDSGYSSYEVLYEEIKSNIIGLEQRYDEEVIQRFTNNKETLNRILFFDGCAILQFIASSFKPDELKELKIKVEQATFIYCDLLLLENQIPYRLLELLMDKSKDKVKLSTLYEFIRRNVLAPVKYKEEIFKAEAGTNPAHLLDLFRLALLQHPAPSDHQTNINAGETNRQPAHDRRDCCGLEKYLLPPIIRQKRARIRYDLGTLGSGGGGGGGGGGGAPVQTNIIKAILQSVQIKLPLIRNRQKGVSRSDHQQGLIEQRDQSFRSVRDLKAAGINLKPSKTCSLKDIKFSSVSFAGELVLPPLIVDDSMAPKFMNLIAYEMCPDNMETNYEVTSYICFLDSLIDYAADVKELRTAGILYNVLGSDKQVEKLFNKIATDLVPDPKVYAEVIEKIEKHCKNKWMTWMAQVCSDHFSTPWTIVAFLAAVIVLFMTAVQTWFTVYSPPG